METVCFLGRAKTLAAVNKQAKVSLHLQLSFTDSHSLHCKNYPFIHVFVSSFLYFNGTGSVYVCIRKSTECGLGLRYSGDLSIQSTNVYGTGSVKICKTRHKISVDTDIFTVYSQGTFPPNCSHRSCTDHFSINNSTNNPKICHVVTFFRRRKTNVSSRDRNFDL